jgi:hypothetical protein
MSYSKIEQYIKIKNNKVDDLSKTKQVVISIKHHNHQWRKFTFSGGGEQSLLNVRQNFQISDIPPPPFALEKTVFSPLLGQNFRKFVNFPWRWGGGGLPPPLRPTKISATVTMQLGCMVMPLKIINITMQSKRVSAAPKSTGPVADATCAIWLIRHCIYIGYKSNAGYIGHI